MDSPQAAIHRAALTSAVPGLELGAGAVLDRLDPVALARAYAAAERWHRGQTRTTGEPYLTHCVAVASIVARMGLDTVAVAAALLHDVIEDTVATESDVVTVAGAETARVVVGLTKLAHMPSVPDEARQVENYRRLLLAMAGDARVLLVKIADRLHNMRTLAP